MFLIKKFKKIFLILFLICPALIFCQITLSVQARPVFARAIEQKNIIATKQLLDKYPKQINARISSSGSTPLQKAINFGHYKLAKFLVESGADVTIHDHYGWTALHYCAFNGKVRIAKLLAQSGVDVNKQGNQGETALHWAINNNQKTMVIFLLEKGANVNITDHLGRTPMDIAIYNNNVVNILQKWGALTGKELAKKYDWSLSGKTMQKMNIYMQLTKRQIKKAEKTKTQTLIEEIKAIKVRLAKVEKNLPSKKQLPKIIQPKKLSKQSQNLFSIPSQMAEKKLSFLFNALSEKNAMQDILNQGVDKILENPSSKYKITTRRPTRDKHWGQLAINTRRHSEIFFYRIKWSGGSWSSWYVPGINDTDWKRNYNGSSRRVWSYFTDHHHQFISVVHKEKTEIAQVKLRFLWSILVNEKKLIQSILNQGVDKILENQLPGYKITTRKPTRDRYWGRLGMDTQRHPEIFFYKIKWFNGRWSSWYVSGINDRDWKGPKRVWTYFTDHHHKFVWIE